MANYLLASIRIVQPFDVNFTAGDLLFISWDDVAEDFYITLNGSDFTTNCLLGKEGVHYSVILGITSSEGGYSIAGYSFCDGADLVWFRMVKSFPQYPFFEKMITVDSPVCDVGGGAVCDIGFVGPITVIHSVDKSTGGSVKFRVTSSNGTIKYALNKDFNYATSGNIASAGENTISGLVPGNYVLYIKDANDCTAIRGFTMLFKPNDLEHYRFSWRAVPDGYQGVNYDARLRIYEREYVGDMVEIRRGDVSPFRLNKPREGLNNKFAPVHPTSAMLSLYSEQDYQFLPLFTQDNKRYRCVYEIDLGSGFVEIWQGFIVPSLYQEDFISVPYTVSIQITDNVRKLEEEAFTDNDGNALNGKLKLIKVISHIMKKTGLSLKIRSGINIFEINHNTAATDDPLDQTYVDVACYRTKDGVPFNCFEVLEDILQPFGARIMQSDGQWLIEEIDRAHEGYAYRVFTADGDYESNGTESATDITLDVKGSSYTDRAAMVDEDQLMAVVPAYGKIDITSKLNYVGSIVAGGFEKTDLLSPESEKFNSSQGIYTSEEGFKDWTYRHNGTSGGSFGRIVIGRRGDAFRTGIKEDDQDRSVGAFYYSHGAWSGNLRNAYIESAVKGYQYGPGSELKLAFEYSTPAKPEYEFMVLRVMLKVGTNYLQPDRTWDTTEAIYRSYPSVSNSLQTFELSVPAPETDEIVDSTIQVRIYFYAAAFFDYGLPPLSTNPVDGTDGLAGLATLVTDGINHDYRIDLRREYTIFALTFVYREFYEIIAGPQSTDWEAGFIRAGDYDGTTNPRVFRRIKQVNIKSDESNTRLRGIDLKFYIDNVALDALINGQPPPTEDKISLSISKYINEDLPIELYNFDLPDIVNGKNMYNNYFRLSDDTPTSKWARSGIDESLPLQKILLKVLGANHSAPTFKLTGTFVNEFKRIGVKHRLKITKRGASFAVTNTEFDSDLSGWSQSAVNITDASFTWTSDDSGSAKVILSNALVDSKRFYQPVDHKGGYVRFTVIMKAIPDADNTREDVLYAIFYDGSRIIHTEKIQTFNQLTSETSYDFQHTAFVPGQVTRIGFYFRNVAGSGTCTYHMSKFLPEGTDIEEIYQIADYQSNEINNEYFLELVQQSKTFISLGNIDTGGTGQSGGSEGREHSSAYSNAYS